MRGLAIAALMVALPLSGCVSDTGGSLTLTLFSLSPIVRGDPTPLPPRSCDDLLETLNERALTRARVELEMSVEGRGYYGIAVADADMAFSSAESGAAPASGASGAALRSSAKDAQVTGTNNQEADADEADFVKTDGEWTYVLRGESLHILHSEEVGDIEPFAKIALGPWAGGGQLILEPRDPDNDADDRLAVVLPTYYGAAAAGLYMDKATSAILESSTTRILVYDLHDRRQPSPILDIWVEGDLAGARLVDGHLYVVAQAWESDLGLRTYAYPTEDELLVRGLDYDDFHRMDEANRTELLEDIALAADRVNQDLLRDATLPDHLPAVVEAVPLPAPLPGSVATPAEYTEPLCRTVLTTPESTGRAVSTIVAVALASEGAETSTTQVVAASSLVYATSDALVLAASSQDAWWFYAQPDLEEATDLHWFELDGLDVRLHASGRVPGTVLDSFSIDVHEDELRVATTTGQWARGWVEDPEPMMSHVVVLREAAGQLLPKGIVGGIAPGERIWSARFTDERAYLVTFRQVDPLWVIDLTGAAPTILGELEIPGVSTYIHPLDDGALLAIGYGPGPGGEGLDWGRIQVSLFDITDPTDPRRAALLDLSPPNGSSWSGATEEHKAFTYWSEIGVLAVPMSSQRYVRMGTEGDYPAQSHVGLKLIDVDRDAMTLSIRGEVSQDTLLRPDVWHAEVERSYFLGYPERNEVSVYAISQLGITAHDLATLALQDSTAFT